MKYPFLLIYVFIATLLGLNCQKEKSNDPIAGPIDEWGWEYLGRPFDDSAILSISIHPLDDRLWFVTSENGNYVTRDGGSSWQNFLTAFTYALEIDSKDPSKIFVSSGKDIYLSEDYGVTWTLKYTFSKYITSMLVSKKNNAVYVGVAWEDSEMANGIYKSTDMGNTWQYYSYNVPEKGILPWDIEEDTTNGKIYIATEIYDHPIPYNPPFLRSSDGGTTWEDISGALGWHATKIQVEPQSSDVYILLEGPGLYDSKDFGAHWEYLVSSFYLDLIIDKKNPGRFFGGNHTWGGRSGGVYQSNDYGRNFNLIGLSNHIVGSLCLDGKSSTLYVASYQSGLYRKKL